MEQITGDLERFEKAVRELNEGVQHLSHPWSTNHANISVGAGGLGIWICATLCALSFVMFFTVLIALVILFPKVDRMQDYWNVTLQYVPGLKDHLDHEKGK